jgi:hypothetical protein
MLKIKNIGRIVGFFANGREIIEAGDYRDVLRKTGKEYFVFKIRAQRDGNDYDKGHDIVLAKIPELNGKYRMFNMGLQLVTEIQISMDEIRIPTELSRCIRNVLVKTKTFYQQNK